MNLAEVEGLEKLLFVDHEKCAGCRTCEITCATYHEGVANPSLARIHVVKWEAEGLDVPVVCQQCDRPACQAVCPTGATHRDSRTGAMLVDEERCIGCRMCVLACPFGATTFDFRTRRILKCNLCDGDPQCAKFCTTGALQYLPSTQAMLAKKRQAGRRLAEAVDTALAG